jgi:hypothetical protein
MGRYSKLHPQYAIQRTGSVSDMGRMAMRMRHPSELAAGGGDRAGMTLLGGLDRRRWSPLAWASGEICGAGTGYIDGIRASY